MASSASLSGSGLIVHALSTSPNAAKAGKDILIGFYPRAPTVFFYQWLYCPPQLCFDASLRLSP
jgi:hypothetical protein